MNIGRLIRMEHIEPVEHLLSDVPSEEEVLEEAVAAHPADAVAQLVD